MRVLNLHAGIGGNRALWPADAEVTAVELDPQIAAAYAVLWTDDAIVVGDAHQYLLDHLLDGWDFVWTSPPCPSHSRLNAFEAGKGRLRYPQLDHLYGEIILLQHRAPAGTRWIVENVIPYYQPLIQPTGQFGRHYAWANFPIPPIPANTTVRIAAEGRGVNTRRKSAYQAHQARPPAMDVGDSVDFEQALGITLPACADTWDRPKRRQVMRNCVDPRDGLAIYNAALGTPNPEQPTLLEAA